MKHAPGRTPGLQHDLLSKCHAAAYSCHARGYPPGEVDYSLAGIIATGEECSMEKSSTNFAAAAFVPAGATPAAPCGRIAGKPAPRRIARRAAKCLGTSIFLIRPIVAPVVQLPA